MNIKHKIQSKIYNYYKKLEVKDHQLLYLFLEITRRCNLNCLHCGSDCTADSNAPELTTESWLKIIKYIKEKFSEKVVFIITGGEPLVHKDLLKIGNAIKNEGMRWGMVTNGMILTEKKLNSLIDAGLYSITLSFDGLKDAHNYIRNSKAAYKKIQTALDVVGKSNIPYRDVVTCVYPKNITQLDALAKILMEKNIPAWRLFRIFPSGRAYENDKLLLTYEQTWQMLDWIKDNKKNYDKKGLNINLSCEGWLPFDIDKQIRDTPFFCRSGVNIASILTDGTITGCSNNDPSFYVGNILKDDFATVWENKFDIFRKREWVNDTFCKNCENFAQCQGGSIHLWKIGNVKPNFCYAKDIDSVN